MASVWPWDEWRRELTLPRKHSVCSWLLYFILPHRLRSTFALRREGLTCYLIMPNRVARSVWVIILKLKVGLHLLQALSHACCVGLFLSLGNSKQASGSRPAWAIWQGLLWKTQGEREWHLRGSCVWYGGGIRSVIVQCLLASLPPHSHTWPK